VVYVGDVDPGPFASFDLHLIDILAKKAAAVLARIERERQLETAKQEAEEASRLKSALLANMSHEIRTPLTSLIGFAGVLRDNLSGQNARYASLVHRGGERLMDTLDSVLQLSKLEAGALHPTAERIDLVATARKIVDLYRSQAEAAAVALRFESEVASLSGTHDPTLVRRVLSNLLSNALKFTPEEGTVTVRVRAPDDQVVLTVADTGVGISDAFRPRLFDAFTQESVGLEREHEGSGLGLAIVQRLVELMDGRIDVDSTKGEGTCIRVVLPRHVAPSGE
jgi:signal transduction histidine kinase